MSKRRILNTTSKKKHDNMAPVAATATGGTPTAGSVTIAGNASYFFVWCPTARNRQAGSDPTSVTNRESDTVFMRGLKESITLRTVSSGTNGAASWLWRRVVFSSKGLYNALGTSVDYLYTSSGYARLLADQNTATYGSAISALLFQGNFGTDWNDLMTAKTDSTRVTILYDKVRRLAPGSASNQIWRYKMWHPMNKNLVYNNEEQGPNETVQAYSTLSKPGMGDVHVVDMFTCATTSASETLAFNPEATIYWHEK